MATQRDHQFTDTNNLMKLFDLGYTRSQIAEMIGSSTSTISTWYTRKRMTVQGSVACEAILRRNGRRAKRRMVLVCVPEEYEAMLKTFMQGIPDGQYTSIKEPNM